MNRDRLNALFAALEEDALTAAEMDELAAWLESSPEHRALAVNQMLMSSQLTDLLADGRTTAAHTRELTTPAVTTNRDPGTKASPAFRVTPLASLVAALALILVVGGLWYAFHRYGIRPGAGRKEVAKTTPASHEPLPVSAPSSSAVVAQLIRQTDCRWSEQHAPTSNQLAVGQELELLAGSAELKFLSGAQVIVQGPAQLQVESENGAVLRLGTAAAHVPPAAMGFTLWSPTMAVVDLGTEFGLHVRPEGTTDLQVFDGAVEVEWVPANGSVSRTLVVSTEAAARLDRRSGEMSRLSPQEVAIPRPAFSTANEEDVAASAIRRASVIADFGGRAGEPDGYPGQSGSGWATPWSPLSSSQVKSERTIVAEHPLLGGGHYLRLAHHSSLEGVGTQTRVYERRQYGSHQRIALDQPHTISWLWRLDSLAGFENPRGDYFKFFDSTSAVTRASEEETTWEVSVNPNTSIRFADVARYDRFEVAVVPGHVYEFTIDVNPSRNEYFAAVRQFDPAAGNQLVREYRSTVLMFRNAGRNPRCVGGYLHFGPGLDHSDNDGREPETGTQVTYSLDRICIAPAGGPAS